MIHRLVITNHEGNIMNSLQGQVEVTQDNGAIGGAIGGALLLAAMENHLSGQHLSEQIATEAHINELETAEGSPSAQPALILGTNAPVPSNFPKPENSASTTGTVETAGEIAEVVAEGRKAGLTVAFALKSGQDTARRVLTETAKMFIGKPQTTIDDWIKGYGAGLLEAFEAGYAKTMKSEAKKVIAAFGIKEYTMTDGMNEDKSPKKVTRTGSEVMQAMKGSYGKWVTTARDIVNGAPNRSTGTGPKKLTETGEKHVKDLIKVAKQDQAAEIASEAIQKLSGPAQCLLVEKVIPKLSNAEGATIADQALTAMVAGYPENWEGPVITQIENACVVISESKDPVIQQLAEAIDKLVSNFFAERAKNEVTTSAATAEAIATITDQDSGSEAKGSTEVQE